MRPHASSIRPVLDPDFIGGKGRIVVGLVPNFWNEGNGNEPFIQNIQAYLGGAGACGP